MRIAFLLIHILNWFVAANSVVAWSVHCIKYYGEYRLLCLLYKSVLMVPRLYQLSSPKVDLSRFGYWMKYSGKDFRPALTHVNLHSQRLLHK